MIKSSIYWRESEVAFDTGLYDKFFDLDVKERAWIIAVMETKNILRQARDYVEEKEREAKGG